MAEENILADITKMGQFINPGTTDIENFLPFGNKDFQTESFDFAVKPEVLPVKVKSNINPESTPTIKQQSIRDNVIGFPPYDKKQIATNTKDKLRALIDRRQQQAYQDEDNSQYAKSFMYDASSTGAHKARYKAYGQKTFDKIGFNPELNNEEVFNANTTIFDDFVRMGTQAAAPMFFQGLFANPKSYAKAFVGDFGQDVEEANSYEEYSSIGMSTKGGLGGFFNNVFNSLAYTGGIMTEAAMEYAAIGAIEGSLVGPEGTVIGGAVGGAAGAIKGLLSVPKSLWNMGKYGGKMLTNLKNLEKFNDAKRLFNTASRTTVNFINPLNNTAQGLGAFTSGDNLSGLARTAKTAGGLFRDVIGMNMALSEGRLEGGFVENNTYNKLYDKFWVEKNRAPTDDEQLEMRKTSKVAGFQDTWKNGLLVFYSNKIAFKNLVEGNFMAGASRKVRQVGKEFDIVYEAGKKGVKEGAYDVVEFNAKNALKGFFKPANFATASINYFKLNVVEGAQEVMQDVIAKATEDYYVNSFFDPSKANFDYSMSTLDAAYKSQLSGQGFETFMSGFVMGGLLRPFNGAVPRTASILYNKYNMDPAAYKTYIEDRNNYATNLAKVMTESHQNPVEFLNERMHNYGSQSVISRNDDQEDSTKQKFDNVEASFLSNTLTTLQAGTHNILNNNFKKYLSLSDTELEETLDIKKGEGAKTRKMLTDYLKKSKNIQEQWTYAQNTFGTKKINLKDLKENTPEYDKAAIYNKALDKGIFNLIFLNESFQNNLERVNKIVNTLNRSELFKNLPSNDFQTLIDSNKLSNTIDMLSTEIENLKNINTPESNRTALEKEKMLSALSLFNQKQILYRETISNNIESLNELQDKVNTENLPNKEEINKEIEGLKKTVEETGVEPKKVLKDAFENLLKTLAGSDVNYQKVLNDLNRKEGGIDSLFSYLIDAEQLKLESQILVPYINLLSQPASFYEHVERNFEWMRNLYLNRKNYYKEIINKSIIAKENNDLLKSLSDQNIYVDLDDFANWVENPNNLPDYFIEATEGNERIIPKGSIAYDKYAYIFTNTADMQREPAAGEQVNVEGQFEEALEDLLQQKQKELDTADENFKRDIKDETDFSYDDLVEQEEKGREVKQPISQLRIDRKIAEIDTFLESLISDDPALIQSRISDFLKNTTIPKEYFSNELLEDIQYKNENDKKKLVEVIKPIFDSYEKTFDKGQRSQTAFDLVGIAELLNNEKERLRTTTEIVTEIEPIEIIKKTRSWADYQKVINEINLRYDSHITNLKTEFTKKGVSKEDEDNDVSVSATWSEIEKQSKELYNILNDKFNSEIGTDVNDDKYELIRNNWLETQEKVITEFNASKAAQKLIEEAEKRQFKAPKFKYIKIQKGYEIKITSKIQPLTDIRNAYQNILDKKEKLTDKQAANLADDLIELDRVINFLRNQGLQQDTTPFDTALQIFNDTITNRQSEIEKVLNEDGELIERKIDGAVADRVTKKAEELNNQIKNNKPFLYSWLQDDVKKQTNEEGVTEEVIIKSTILSDYDAIMADASIKDEDKLDIFIQAFKLKVLNSAKSNVFRSKDSLTLNPIKFEKIEKELTKDFSRENVIAVIQRAAYQEAADVGNMLDVLIKDFLTREGLQFKKIVKPEKMSQSAFDSLFGDRGIITNFRDGVIDGKYMIVSASDMLFDKSLFENGLVGETDLIAISAEGKFSIIDVKALLGKSWKSIIAENNLEKLKTKLNNEGKTEAEINSNADVIKLTDTSKYSKKLYFRIQQSIYRNLFYNMTGIMPERISLLPIEVNYDREGNLLSAKLSDIVSDSDLTTYELDYFNEVESIVPLKTPVISAVDTIETTDKLVEEIGASTSLKDNIGKKVLYNGEVGTLIFNDNGTFSIQIDPIKTYETKTTVTEDLTKQDFIADQDTLKIAINTLKENLKTEEGEFGNVDKANDIKQQIVDFEKQLTPITDTTADIVEVPTKSKIIDLYYESSAVTNPKLSLNNVGLSQVKETKKVFETIIINNVSYTTRILNKNTVLINDVLYRVNYSGTDPNIIASLTYDVNDAEIAKLEKEENTILNTIQQLQKENKSFTTSTDEPSEKFNSNVNTIGKLTMDLKGIRQTLKELNNNNPQRTMRGGNINDYIFAINSSPQNFKLYAGKTNDDRKKDLEEISRLSYSPGLAIKLDEILAKNYPDALNKLFDEGVPSITDSELKAIKTWSNTVLEDLTELASQVTTRGDISTDVDNQIIAINNLINDLQLITLTKNGKISKRSQEESEKVFGQQAVSDRTSVPENEKSRSRKTKGVSGQKTRNVTNAEAKQRITETLVSNSFLLGNIPTEKENVIETTKKGKKFIDAINKATIDTIRTKYIEALTQIETDPLSINTDELHDVYNNRLTNLNVDMSIENLDVNMLLLPKNTIFDNTNINPVKITNVTETYVTVEDVITGEKGDINQTDLKLNFIKMNEEAAELENDTELTKEDIQNAEDSQMIYDEFSKDTDAQSKIVDYLENNDVSEDDLLKSFNNNTKIC